MQARKVDIASFCWTNLRQQRARSREGRYEVEQLFSEPVELTESELDAVAGGFLNFTGSFNSHSFNGNGSHDGNGNGNGSGNGFLTGDNGNVNGNGNGNIVIAN
jgi:hypothetical protein